MRLEFHGNVCAGPGRQHPRTVCGAGRDDCPARIFLLAGSMYPTEWTWPAGVKRVEHVAPSDHPALYSSSRATLNLTRKRDGAVRLLSVRDVSLKPPLAVRPLLTDAWEGLDSFFDPLEELMVVRTAEDVVQALQLPDAELARMAARARERTLDEHTGHATSETAAGGLRRGSPALKPQSRRHSHDRYYPRRRSRTAHSTARLLEGTAARGLARHSRSGASQGGFRVSGGTHDRCRCDADLHDHLCREERHRSLLR